MHLILKPMQAALFICILLGSLSIGQVQGANKKASVQRHKLIPLTPILDTSKEIKYKLFCQDYSGMMHGDSRVFSLSATEKTFLLQGNVKQEEYTSTLKTSEHDIKPRFQVDLRKLAAKYAPDIAYLMENELARAKRKMSLQVASQEQLMQKELKAQVPVPDIPVAHVKSVPDIPNLQTGIKQIGIPNLDTSKTVPDIPKLQTGARQIGIPNLDISKTVLQLQTALSNTKGPPGIAAIDNAKKQVDTPKLLPMKLEKIPNQQIDTSTAEKLMGDRLEKARTKALSSSVKIPQLTARPAELPKQNLPKTDTKIPLQLTPEKMPPKPKLDTTLPEKLLEQRLVNAKLRTPDELELNTTLQLARKNAQATVKQAKPAMDTILTSLRAVPRVKIPSADDPLYSEDIDAKMIVKWDEWHARFASLAKDPIMKEVNDAGSPSGNNTVEITVQRNHKLSVRLIKAGNKAFDSATLQAYQSINGLPSLEFPAGSRRSSITFQIDNKHSSNGIVAKVESVTSIGDKEIVHHK